MRFQWSVSLLWTSLWYWGLTQAQLHISEAEHPHAVYKLENRHKTHHLVSHPHCRRTLASRHMTWKVSFCPLVSVCRIGQGLGMSQLRFLVESPERVHHLTAPHTHPHTAGC